MSISMRSGARKERSVTMADVAREAGVTKTAVSFALNGTGSVSPATRQIVVEAARRLGFEPNPHAQNLSNGRSNNTIGLFTLWVGLGVGAEKIVRIQTLLNARGFDVPLYGIGLHNSFEEETQVAALASIRRQRPRALMCFIQGMRAEALVELRRYRDEGGILVCCDYAVDVDCDQVIFDREDNTYQATKHLLQLGHRRIGYGSHSFLTPDNLRVRGFVRAMEEFGGQWRAEWLLEGRDSGNPEQGGQSLAAQFLSLADRPSAFCIVNDASALVFSGELERAGVRCPRDVSVVGHDDLALSRFASVPLTTVTHPSQSIAEHVTEFLLSRLNGEYNGPARKISVRGELILRQSAIAPL